MEYGHTFGEPIQNNTKVRKKIEINNTDTLFLQYFDNPTLQKIRDDEFSVYMTCVKCMIIGTCRYIVVNARNDGLPVGTKRKLSDLNWLMIQTRTMEKNAKTTNHTYMPKTDEIFESQLSITKRTKKYSEYSCENIPIKVTIFHKKDLEFEYPNNGNLNSAIEIYNTVVQKI